MRWIYTQRPAGEIEAFGKLAGINPVLSELLLAGGVTEVAAAAASLDVFTAIRRDGTQRHVVGKMQTRAELYDILGYKNN